MSRVIRKPTICICENKDADQLRGNRAADQRLCFRYKDSTITLLSKSEISRLLLSSVVVQPGLCGTWSETPKTGFLRTRLIWMARGTAQSNVRLSRAPSRTGNISKKKPQNNEYSIAAKNRFSLPQPYLNGKYKNRH